ncbi:MAG TPA: DUF5719 family protein [Actinomycetota bacterium]|nr:DUF5719 family protein [Actinomycetota bacterium]
MSERSRMRNLLIVLGVGLILGAGLDALAGQVDAPASDVSAEAGIFQTRAAFCPPPFSKRNAVLAVAVEGDPGAPATIRLDPIDSKNSDLAADRLLLHRGAEQALEAVGYGAHVHASALLSSTKPVTGSDAARCPRTVSDHWYFPAGSSLLGYDERILVRNPFADEAVISVTFVTPSGLEPKAGLSDIAIPAGESHYVKVNDFLLRQPVLGAEVTATRGRVVAWRAMFAASDERPDGVYFGLGASGPATDWYFPEGEVGRGLDEVITLLNPNKKEAVVSISLATASRSVQPPKLVEEKIPAQSVKAISLPANLDPRDQSLGGVGAIVHSLNGTGVIAERTVWYAASRTGVTSSMGATAPSPGWVIAPPAVSNPADDLVIMNPGREKVTASVYLMREGGGPVKPASLQKISIKAGTRVRRGLNDWSHGTPMAVVVVADGPVVAERVATTGNGDVATLVGDAFTPNAQ